MESRWVRVNDIGIHYLDGGEGHPLLLLHGLFTSSLCWINNISILKRHFRVLAPDLPGHGLSEKPDIRYTTREGVDFLLGFLDALGIERAHLVGNSVGGLLAFHLALEQPDRVRRLVLASSVGLGRRLPLYLRLGTIPFLAQWQRLPARLRVKLMARAVFRDPSRIPGEVREDLLRSARDPRVRRAVTRAVRHAVDLGGLRRELLLASASSRLSMPVLIVHGNRDHLLAPDEASEASALIRDCRVHILEGCGHWPQMERPEEFNRLVLEFLEGPSHPSSGFRDTPQTFEKSAAP